MLAISNQNQLSETTYNDIIKGQFTNLKFNTFQLFLNFLNDLPSCNAEFAPIGRPMPTGRDAVPCIKFDGNHILEKASFYQDLTKNNHLKNSFNYLKSVIDQQANNIRSPDVEKLLHICHNFFTIYLTNLNLTSIEINDITEAYFDFFASIANFPETIHIHSNTNNLQIFDLMHLSVGYFSRLNKLNGNVSLGIEPANLTYLIYSPLKSYLGGLGNLALNFRNEYPDANLYPFENNAVKLINSMTNLTVDQLSNARYTFLSQYHNNPDVLTECKRVFNTTNCDPYQFNTQYNLISQGRTLRKFSAAEALAKKLLFGSKNDITSRLKTLSTTTDKNNGLANFLDYFKATVKEANKNTQVLSINFVKDLSSLAFYLTDVFKETKPKSRIYDSLFSLVLTLLKNPSISDHHLHVWHAIQACTDQMLDRLADQTEIMLKKPQIGIDSSMNILADIFHQTMDIPAVSPSDKKEIAEIIKKLSIACLKIDTCDSFSALNQFSKTLGSMVRSLSKKNKTEIDSNAVQVIETAAQKIIQNANNTISEPELAGLRWSYLKGRYDNNTKAIQNDCQRVFSSNNCHEFIAANETKIQEEIFTTVIPETTMPTVIQAMNMTELPSSNSNQTVAVTEANSNNSALTNSGLTLGASAAHGAGSGMLNGIIQYFAAKHSQRGEPTSTTKAVIIYSSLLAQAAFATTFPLMLYKIQEHINQGNEDEAQQLWDNLLLQALPTFISSVGFSMGLQIVYEYTRLLSNRVRAIAQNTLPLVGTAVSLFRDPVATGVQMATSIAISSLTYGLFNRFSPVSNTNFLDLEKAHENKSFEMEPLNKEKENDSNNATEVEKKLTPEEIFFKKVEFTTPEQFKKLKEYLNNIVELVKELQSNLSDQVHIDRLEQILANSNSNLGLSYDLIDLENFPNKFITQYNECKNDNQKMMIVKSNFDYFKTMIKTIYDKLLSDNINNDCLNYILCSIKETKTLKNSITKLIKSIEDNLSFIRGITKPLVSIHLAEEPALIHKNGTAILFRQHNISINNVNRHTVPANGYTNMRISSDSEGSSKDGEDIQINRSLLRPR